MNFRKYEDVFHNESHIGVMAQLLRRLNSACVSLWVLFPFKTDCLANSSSLGHFVSFWAFDRGMLWKRKMGRLCLRWKSSRFRMIPWIWRLRTVFVSYLFPNNWEVISQKRVRVFHRGFQTQENVNWWKHETVGRVILLFLSLWRPQWNTKHELNKNNFGIVRVIWITFFLSLFCQ